MDRLKSGTRWLQLAAATVVGYLVSLVTALFSLAWIDGAAIVKLIFLLVGGFVIGAVARRVPLFAARPYLLATCAFLAALTLWIPVIFVTYGFALIGVPLLGLYSGAVLAGWRVSEKLDAGT
ncbi:MAG: hypothetical protein V4693_10880 [Pseudomonadota bacterium]